MTAQKPDPAKRAPLARQAGLATRRQLLEAAGEIFAEHGYARATSKEICARANANIAAVNYHFGGKDGLYAAVLEEAHARLMSLDALTQTARSPIDPRLKLKALLGRIVGEIMRAEKSAWGLRVLSRELLSPSPLMEDFINHQIAPKAKMVRAILAEIMQLPPDHPAVSRAAVNVMGPCLLMLITTPALLQKAAPKLGRDAEALTEHMVAYALGGMQAVARKAK